MTPVICTATKTITVTCSVDSSAIGPEKCYDRWAGEEETCGTLNGDVCGTSSKRGFNRDEIIPLTQTWVENVARAIEYHHRLHTYRRESFCPCLPWSLFWFPMHHMNNLLLISLVAEEPLQHFPLPQSFPYPRPVRIKFAGKLYTLYGTQMAQSRALTPVTPPTTIARSAISWGQAGTKNVMTPRADIVAALTTPFTTKR